MAKKRKRNASQKVPYSENKLVDWHFKQIIKLLRSGRVKIKRKKRVIDPDTGQQLAGLMELGTGPYKGKIFITISTSKRMNFNRDAEASTMTHELCHCIHDDAWEPAIKELEKILWEELSYEQKQFLKHFLPRHEVKG